MATSYGEGRTINVTLAGTVTVGDVFEGVNGIGVYMGSGVSGDVVALLIQGEVTVAKATGTAYAVLDQLYYDTTNDELTKTNTDVPAGLCTAAAASGDTTARLLLNVGSGDS